MSIIETSPTPEAVAGSPSFMPGVMPAFVEAEPEAIAEPVSIIADEPRIIESDGLLLDADTGEVVGYVAQDGGQITDPEAKPTVDEGLVNWILRKMLGRKAKIQSAQIAMKDAGDSQEALIESYMRDCMQNPTYIANLQIIANCESIVARESKQLNGFEKWFAEPLARFATEALKGARTRTWFCPFGSLALKAKPSKLVIVDEKAFIAWAEVNCPDAVKVVKSALISKLPKTTAPIADIPADGDDAPIFGNGLKMTEATDELTITPGAK